MDNSIIKPDSLSGPNRYELIFKYAFKYLVVILKIKKLFLFIYLLLFHFILISWKQKNHLQYTVFSKILSVRQIWVSWDKFSVFSFCVYKFVRKTLATKKKINFEKQTQLFLISLAWDKYQFPRVTMTKHHKLGGSCNRTCYRTVWSQKSEWWQSHASSETYRGSLLPSSCFWQFASNLWFSLVRWCSTPTLHLHVMFSVHFPIISACQSLCPNFPFTNASHIGLGSSLMARFSLDCICKDLVSKFWLYSKISFVGGGGAQFNPQQNV